MQAGLKHAHFAGATLQGNSQTIGIDQETHGAIDYNFEELLLLDMTRELESAKNSCSPSTF